MGTFPDRATFMSKARAMPFCLRQTANTAWGAKKILDECLVLFHSGELRKNGSAVGFVTPIHS